jgi:hypothetical protein
MPEAGPSSSENSYYRKKKKKKSKDSVVRTSSSSQTLNMTPVHIGSAKVRSPTYVPGLSGSILSVPSMYK